MRALFVRKSSTKTAWIIAAVGVLLALVAYVADLPTGSENGLNAWLNRGEAVNPGSSEVATVAIQPGPTVQEPASDSAAKGSAQSVVPVEQSVHQFLDQWAADWSERDLDAYSGAYSEVFRPETHKSKADWLLERRSRILSKKKIVVRISELAILSSSDKGTDISFTQAYEADQIKSVTVKYMTLVTREGRWQIVRERTK
jgi:hypothetical protein